jgi:hypothetical protein
MAAEGIKILRTALQKKRITAMDSFYWTGPSFPVNVTLNTSMTCSWHLFNGRYFRLCEVWIIKNQTLAALGNSGVQ